MRGGESGVVEDEGVGVADREDYCLSRAEPEGPAAVVVFDY